MSSCHRRPRKRSVVTRSEEEEEEEKKKEKGARPISALDRRPTRWTRSQANQRDRSASYKVDASAGQSARSIGVLQGGRICRPISALDRRPIKWTRKEKRKTLSPRKPGGNERGQSSVEFFGCLFFYFWKRLVGVKRLSGSSESAAVLLRPSRPRWRPVTRKTSRPRRDDDWPAARPASSLTRSSSLSEFPNLGVNYPLAGKLTQSRISNANQLPSHGSKSNQNRTRGKGIVVYVSVSQSGGPLPHRG